MERHPNEFTRRIVCRYFTHHQVPVEVNAVRGGYVIFFTHFSLDEACDIDEPSGRLVFDERNGDWRLYWISGNFHWHLYERCETLHEALDTMLSEEAAGHFQKVL